MKFSSSRLNINYGRNVFDISDDSEMKLFFSYFNDNGKIVWDISAFDFWENKNIDNFISISRELKPEKGMKDSFFTAWNLMIQQKKPFDKSPYVDKNTTYIKGIHTKYDFLKKNAKDKTDFIYTITMGYSEKIGNFALKKKYSNLDSVMAISE